MLKMSGGYCGLTSYLALIFVASRTLRCAVARLVRFSRVSGTSSYLQTGSPLPADAVMGFVVLRLMPQLKPGIIVWVMVAAQ